MKSSRKRASIGLLMFVVLLPGCGRSVTVQPPRDAEAAAQCQTLKDSLPDTLAGERRLSIRPPSPHTAAWGAPALVWRCGVPEPAALGADSQSIVANDAEWFPEELQAGVRFTSMDRSPRIELTVPAIYPEPVGLLTVLP